MAAISMTKRCAVRVPGLVASGACWALYLRTITPGVMGGDAGELQFVPYILGLTHPTGYPLLTLLGKLWVTIVPVGSVACRMNLLSTLAAALTIGLIYGAIQSSTGSRLYAFCAALLLGTSEVFWGQAISADKYALNGFLLALVVFALVRWSRVPSERGLRWCAFLYGLSLTHHRSMLALLPFLVGYWLWHDPSLLRHWRSLSKIALLVFLPLLLYLWLPIGASRGLPPGTWQPASLQEWSAYILDRGYLSAIRPDVGLWQKVAFYGRTLLAQFTAFGVILGLVGAIHQVKTRNPIWVFLASGFVSQVVLASSYEVPRQWVFFLPSFMLFVLWIGEGLVWLSSTAISLGTWSPPLGYGLTGVVLASCILLAPLTFWRNYPTFRERHLDGGSLDIWRQDLKSGYLAQRFAENSLPLVEPDSIIVADWEQSTPLWYSQQVEKRRPDVTVIYPIDRWPEALATGRPTYLARTLPGIGEPYHVTALGALVRVADKPNIQLPVGIFPKEINWENKIELLGYQFYQTAFSIGYVWPVSLYLRAIEPLKADYSISLRLVAKDGKQVWAEDRQHFVLGMYPTTRWVPGAIVGDYFEVPFPRSVPAGRYDLRAVLYHSTSDGNWHNLTIAGSASDVADICSIDVPVRQ